MLPDVIHCRLFRIPYSVSRNPRSVSTRHLACGIRCVESVRIYFFIRLDMVCKLLQPRILFKMLEIRHYTVKEVIHWNRY